MKQLNSNIIRLRKLMIFLLFQLIIVLVLSSNISESSVEQTEDQIVEIENDFPDPEGGCLACHAGLAPIREHHSGMMQAIYELGNETGDPNGCTVCHSGDANEEKFKHIAHKELVRYPSSMWVNERTCGRCHEEYIYAMNRSLMQTEAGKIQGAMWGWGAPTGYKAVYGNYNIKDPDGKKPVIGNEKYENYLSELHEKHSYAFPDSLELLPETDLSQLAEHPETAVYTYIRGECQRCHVGVKGAKRRGDYRGMGCSSCHIPYSVEGFYEGDDPSISKTEPGHMLVHSIQATREAKVTTKTITYSGIPSEECTACHNRGKRVGVSFLGIMESAYNSPWTEEGNPQRKLHGKNYQYIREDAHHSLESREGNPKGRLLCQDCHTTADVHGNGNIHGTTLAAIEIECFDCHGTPDKYPWELPLGYGEEFDLERSDEARGTGTELLIQQKKFGTTYEMEDGYVLTARGNPFGNVIRRQNDVIVQTAGGQEFKVPVLKNVVNEKGWDRNRNAYTAMVGVQEHMNNMECYACHSTWAAQCYGCHVKVDYSMKLKSRDWVKCGNNHFPNGETAETHPDIEPDMMPGKSYEGRSYLRWEDPILGINGEGRVSPLIPGCQQITTVIDEDGEFLALNKIWRTPAGMENGGEQGQLGTDVTPAQPHTVGKKARTCVSCHTNPKTLGYGISDGEFMKGYESERYKDISSSTGELLAGKSTPQFEAIPELLHDLSKIVTRDGEQLQTVGHHWKLSGPLTQYQREKMERVGVCISCHQDLPDGNMFVSALTSIGDKLDLTPYTDNDHSKLLNRDINLIALIQVLAPFLVGVIIILILIRRYRKKRRLS
jgi:hypothetical protein